ncbi:MAG: hypothetical protein K2Q09_03550 [Phycisphaerales bacterium]|nr:hypothetical protein [Phycisphaerales bacterium]
MSAPAFILRLKKRLKAELERAGIPAEIDSQPVGGTKLHRLTVIAAKFAKLRFSERQALVWRIVDEEVPKEQLFISIILTLTPSEASGESAA